MASRTDHVSSAGNTPPPNQIPTRGSGSGALITILAVGVILCLMLVVGGGLAMMVLVRRNAMQAAEQQRMIAVEQMEIAKKLKEEMEQSQLSTLPDSADSTISSSEPQDSQTDDSASLEHEELEPNSPD